MEKLVEELRKIVNFKQTTREGDFILVAAESPQMLFYGMVTSIERDLTKKDEWWHLGVTLLTVPPQEVVWTLREQQFTGQEIFTMDGNKRFIKAVELSIPTTGKPTPSSLKKGSKTALRVIK